MDAVKAQPRASFLGEWVRRFRHFEKAMETLPVDHLELRVADLERRLAALGGGASGALRSKNFGKV